MSLASLDQSEFMNSLSVAISTGRVERRASEFGKLSTVEGRRRAAGVSRAALAAAASISERWLAKLLREPHRVSPEMVGRLERALSSVQAEAQARQAPAIILATYGGFLVAIAPHYGVTPTEVRATDPRRGATADRHWQRCAHARQAALYLTHIALGLPQRRLAAAMGLTPAAVCLACQDVEDRRSDPKFEAALLAAQRDVTGEADA